MPRKIGFAFFLAVILVLTCNSQAARAQSDEAGPNRRPLITQTVDEAQRVTLAGNTRPEVRAETIVARLQVTFRWNTCCCS